MANRTKRTAKTCEAFLAALRTGGSAAYAAGKAGVGRTAVYEWRAADPEFAAEWDSAVEEGTDRLEDEAVRRGAIGVETPVFYKGRQIASVKEYSDMLLQAQLNARRPDKYRARGSVEMTGKDGGPLVIQITPTDSKL